MREHFKKLVVLLAIVMAICNFGTIEHVMAADGNGTSGNNKTNEEVLSTGTANETTSDEGEVLDDNESDLEALGFDISKIPEGYDEDSQENPNGSEYATLQQIRELFFVDRNKSVLYGHNNHLDDDYSTFMTASREAYMSAYKESVSAAAAGNFRGKGKDSDYAYVSIEKKEGANLYDVNLRIYDQTGDKTSAPYNLVSGLQYTEDYYMQSYIDISTGDYDGDGSDEVAVMIPQKKTEAARIAVYKLKSDDISITGDNSWKEVWSYMLPEKSYYDTWNSIDIASGDINNDKIEDMIISYGRTGFNSIEQNAKSGIIDSAATIKSVSVALYGNKSGQMLQDSQTLSYNNKDLCRVAFAIADINDDSINEVILGGQKISDAAAENTTRCLGSYIYNEATGRLELETLENIKVVDGSMKDGKWVSANGYDDKYHSLPAMKANIAVAEIYGKKENCCIYLDSVLYRMDGDGFSIVDELDDEKKTDNTAEPFYSNYNYVEYNASEGYFTGAVSQGIAVERTIWNNGPVYSCDILSVKKETEEKEDTEDDTLAPIVKTSIREEKCSDTTCISSHMYSMGSYFVLPDTDVDGATMKYTGNHGLVYSSPEVFAVLASAPYFKDVAENADGGNDIKAFSGTSWGTSKESGSVDGSSLSTDIGGLVIIDAITYNQQDSIGWTHGHDINKTKSTEFAISYSIAAGKDYVVFYSVPMAVYEYEVEYAEENEQGQYVRKTGTEYITIPYQPVTQTITMDTYNEIQRSNTSLPVLDGTAITSKCGDPASYPSSIYGLNKAVVYDGNWSSPSYSPGGSVKQDITFSDSTSDTSANGAAVAHMSAGGAGVKGGAYFNVNKMKISGTVTTKASSASGTVYNMVPSAKDYGYYFSWKLMTYKYKTPEGNEIPVVTYLTDDVTEPPTLPGDFRQDYNETTDSEVALKWTYSDPNATSFDIYRHNEFTEGSNDVLVGTVKAGDYTLKKDKEGKLVYDKDGKPIRQYSFKDGGLSDYTEYEYRLQVKRDKAPSKSIPTAPLKCKTRAIYHPEINLSENELTVYYDTITSVTAEAKESDSFIFKNKTFQWQKYNNKTEEWEDIDLANTNQLKFSKSSLDDKGEYRCRVNSEISALGNIYRITAYSETLKVEYSRRNVKFGQIECEENGNALDVSVKVTNSGDTVSQPKGNVIFTIDDGQDKKEIISDIDNTTHTASARIENLKNGAYEISARYIGNSRIFKDAEDNDTYMYMKGIESGYWISAKETYTYMEDVLDSLKVYELEANGTGSADKRDVTDQIFKVDMLADDIGTYAQYQFLPNVEKSAPIICIDNYYAHFDSSKLTVNIGLYGEAAGDTLTTIDAGKKTINVKKNQASIYVDDIKGQAGEDAPSITVDDLRIKGAIGYDDGDSPFLEKDMQKPDLQAFTDKSRFNIAIFADSGDFLGFVEEPHATDPRDTRPAVDIKTLPPGKYKLRPIGGAAYSGRGIGEDEFFDLAYEKSTLTLMGNTYYITAEGNKINGRDVGSVSLISPDKHDNVDALEFEGGTELVFKAHPAINYAVKNWTVTSNGTTKTFDSTADTVKYIVKGTDNSIKISVNFVLKESRIGVEAIGGGSDSTITCMSDNLGNNPIISCGKELTFKAEAGAGYDFTEWRYVSVDGKTIVKKGAVSEDGSTSEVQFTMGESSATVYAVFARQKAELSLSENLTACYVRGDSDDDVEIRVSSDMKVPKGSDVIVRPEAGFKAGDSWSVEGVDASSVRMVEGGTAIRFTVPDDAAGIKVAADCQPGLFGISTESLNETADISVRVNDAETDQLDCIKGGSTVEFTATPKRGYEFKGWKINNQEVDNSSSIYATRMTGNMSVLAVCEKSTEHSITAGVKGDGSVKYVIETPYGRKIEGELGAETDTFSVFEGETVKFSLLPNDTFMTSYLVIDGKREAFTDNTYVLSDIREDKNITFGFDPAVYHIVTIENNSDYKISTESGEPVGDSISLGGTESCTLIVEPVYDPGQLFVYMDGIGYRTRWYQDKRYAIDLKDIEKDSVLTINKYETFFINSAQGLIDYRNKNGPNTVAILTDDIDMTDHISAFFGYETVLQGTLDGNGHCLYGLNMSTSYGSYYRCLFETIDSMGAIKNLTIKDSNLNFYVDRDAEGIFAHNNNGLIENCVLSGVKADFAKKYKESDETIGAVAGTNNGVIRNILIKDVELNIPNGASGIAWRCGENGRIENCYIDGMKVNSEIATADLLFSEGNGNNFSNCYYNIGNAAATGENCGTSVWKNGEKLSPGEIAYRLNATQEKPAWGITSNDTDISPLPISSVAADVTPVPVPPLQIKFKGYKTYYMLTDIIDIPTAEESGGVKAWNDGTVCYGAGTTGIKIKTSHTFTPVMNPENEFGCKVSYDGGVQYFGNLRDAVKFADSTGGADILITSDKIIDKSLEIGRNISIALQGDITVEIESGAAVENNGILTLVDGAEIINYGSFQNNKDATLDIGKSTDGGTFTNGGRFRNFGTISDQKLIKCINHDWGKEVVVEPTRTEPGSRTVTCNACLLEKIEEIPATESTIYVTCDAGEKSFDDLKSAIEYANEHEKAIVIVTADTAMETGVVINEGVSLDIRNAELTIEDEAILTNNGTITLTDDSDVINNGSFINSETGALDMGENGSFINNGDFSNAGTISDPGRIECREHNFLDNIVEPTCTEGGYTEHVCKVCGYTIKDSESEAAGHSLSQWVTVKDSSCSENGYKFRFCTKCGYTETENIEPLEHSWEVGYTVDKEPGCVSEGSESIHCSNCDAVKDSRVIPASGHQWNDGEISSKSTFAADGVKTYTCEKCESTRTEVIPKLIAALERTKYTYNGRVKCPAVTVNSGGVTLIEGTDYKATYSSGRKTVGKYTVTINGTGNYSGKTTRSFTIKPATPIKKSIVSGVKKMTVKLSSKPSSKGASYYQIAYKCKGTSTWRYIRTSSYYRTVKSLKKGKQYYVKIRAYKSVSGTKYYSAWTKTYLSKKIK